MTFHPPDLAVRLLVALLMGGAIGLERQIHHHEAALRTNTLVSLGSALYITLALALGGDGGTSRVAAQIITGVGFLGGGVILRDGFHIRGLTTAATLWCAAAIGTVAGMGLYLEAAAGTAAVLLVNIVIRRMSNRIGGDSPPPVPAMRVHLRFVVDRDAEAAALASVLESARTQGFHISSQTTEPLTVTQMSSDMQFDATTENARFDPIIENLSRDARIHSFSWHQST